jgi:PadR family transcriptional regulator, regulatory protein PadR
MAARHSAQHTLDLLVLTLLERRGTMHGYAIASTIQQLSEEALRVDEGSLYPALYRMAEAGWIRAEWRTTENSRRARMYQITRTGTKRLAEETERWDNFAAGVTRVLRRA